MAFYTGGLRLLLFTNLVLVTVIKEEGGGGKEEKAREEDAFSRVPGTKDGLYAIWKRRSPKRGEGREGRGECFCECWETSIVTGLVSKR